MDYRMTDEQELLLDSIQEWMERNIDENEVKSWYKNHSVPEALTKDFVDQGFGFLGIPEEYGGTPCDVQTLMMVSEKMHYYCASCVPFLSSILSMFDMLEFGNEQQVKLCMDTYKSTGKLCFALALSEPGAGSDNNAMTTCVKQVGEGRYIVNGTKTFVTNGGTTPYVLLICKDDTPDYDNKSYSMFLVPTQAKGISFAPMEKIGQTCSAFSEMYISDLEITEEQRVGKKGEAFLYLMKNFEVERMLIASGSLGMAQAVLEDAVKYANERITFGKQITKYQLIQQKLTDMEIKCQNMRNMLYKAAWEKDNGISVRLDSALVKRYCSMTATEVCYDAMQIFGGIGYTTETRASRAWIDCRGNEFAGGTDEIMVHIANRQIIKKYIK